MSHRVWAREDRGRALLECKVCQASAFVSAFDLEDLNAFLHGHMACADGLPPDAPLTVGV